MVSALFGLAGTHMLQDQRQGNVLRERQMRQDVERLKDKSDRLPPELCARIVAKSVEHGAFDGDTAGIGGVEPRDEVEQGGFAGSRFTHDRDEFARGQGEIEPVKQDPSAGHGLLECGHGQQRRGGRRSAHLPNVAQRITPGKLTDDPSPPRAAGRGTMRSMVEGADARSVPTNHPRNSQNL